MNGVLSDRSSPERLAILFVVVVLVALVVAASVSGVAFGLYTPTWEGTSEFRSIADSNSQETVIVTETSQYDSVEPTGALGVVIASEEPYDETDRERISGFVESGGTLVVADASGEYTNPLLESVGATARIDGDPLRDERAYDSSPAFPIAEPTSQHPYVAGAGGLTLNHGSAIDPGEASVLARSSELSYLDRTGSGTLEEDDEMADHAVVTLEPVEEGQVVVVSDGSVFINAMLDRDGNRGLAEGLVSTHQRVLFDVTHSGEIPPLVLATLTIRESAAMLSAIGLGFVFVIGAVYRWPRVRELVERARSTETETTGFQEADVVAMLEQRYPEWDPNRRERVATAVMSHREEGGGDE